jgi:hypothetical protein
MRLYANFPPSGVQTSEVAERRRISLGLLNVFHKSFLTLADSNLQRLMLHRLRFKLDILRREGLLSRKMTPLGQSAGAID